MTSFVLLTGKLEDPLAGHYRRRMSFAYGTFQT